MRKSVLAGLGALLLIAPAVAAGPNTGVLILAEAEGVVYTGDIDDYCGAATIAPCLEAITAYDGTDTIVLSVIAHFIGSPRLAGVTFGVDYPESDFFIVDFGSCGDFELPTGGWPGPGDGTAVTWSTAQTAQATEIYWFAGYNYYGNSVRFDLADHPGQGGASFADDDIPSNLDPVQALGGFGFGGDPGSLPCITEEVGACCDRCGDCTVVTPAECEDSGGEYQGDLTFCDPNPCAPLWGACCFDDGSCEFLNICDCEEGSGDFQGDQVECDPDPCVVVPTIDSTWGQLKHIYR